VSFPKSTDEPKNLEDKYANFYLYKNYDRKGINYLLGLRMLNF